MSEVASDLHERTRLAFEQAYDRVPEVVASAPGRVNLLGEHTDYNEGYVLPTALPLRTSFALARRSDGVACVRTDALGLRSSCFSIGAERPEQTWLDYVQGLVVAAREHGYACEGFDAFVSTQLPLGGGLSSSAALAVAGLRALRDAFGWKLEDVELARIAQWSENHFVGAPVGVMDPMACHLGDEDSALFIDTRSLQYERLPLPSAAELVIAESGVRHSHATGSYRQRREECEAAAWALGVRSLRDVTEEMRAQVAALTPPLDRRAKHVLTENDRVLRAVQALRDDDPVVLGALFVASHVSMRDDFEVSVPEVDRIVEAAVALPSVYGARLTGGGFGGAVVCLVERGQGARVAAALEPLCASVIVCGKPSTR